MTAIRFFVLAPLAVLLVSGCVRSEDALDNAGFSGTDPQPSAKLSLAAPPNVSHEAMAPNTVVDLGTPVVDGGSGQVQVDNDAPDTGFPVGETAVVWTAIDNDNDRATDTQMVVIRDTTPPELTAPADIVANAIAPNELTVIDLGMAEVSDMADPDPQIRNDASGPGFPVGITNVTWTATDAHGNRATAIQTVTINAVFGGSNLSIVAPADIDAEATAVNSPVMLGQPFVQGGIGDVEVTNDAPIAGFPVGETIVTWTATDDTQSRVMAAQRVRILDTRAPTIRAPADVIAVQSGDLTPLAIGMAVVSDLGDPNPVVTNDAPDRGYPLGTTTVTWTVTDRSGNSASTTQLVTVNVAAVACSSLEPEFSSTVYPILDTNGVCANCHTPPNTVNTANDFNFQANDSEAFALFRTIASIDIGGESSMLVKALGGAGHGGGNRFPDQGESDPNFAAIAELVAKLDVCTPDPPPVEDGVVLGTGYEQLYKITMSLGARVPTQAESDTVAAANGQAAIQAALVPVIQGLMNEDAFYARLKEIYNDLLLTDMEMENAQNPRRVFDLNQFADENFYLDESGDRRQDANYGIARAPLELVNYVVRNNLPFTEILTADYMMVNPYSAAIFGVDAGDPSFPYNSGGNPADYDRDDFRPARGFVHSDGKTLPNAGVLTTHAFLDRYRSTATNVNRARARYVFDYFLGVDIEGLAPRDALDLDNVIGDVPTYQDPQCKVCHDVMDPVAGLFKNRANRGAYGGDRRWENSRFTNGIPRMLDPGYTMDESDKLPASDTAAALPWLAQRLAGDDRFAQKTVRTVFQGFTGIEESSVATTDYLQKLKVNFQASGYNLKILIRDVHLGPYFLGTNLADGNNPNQFPDVGTGRKLTPEELYRKLAAVIGDDYQWVGPETGGGLLDEHRLMYGGIDSLDIIKRTTEANAMSNGIQLRIANQVACERVAAGLDAGGTLFPFASPADVPDTAAGRDRIRRNIQFLHRRLLGEDLTLDDPEIQSTYQLFLDVRALGRTDIPAACRGGGAATDGEGTIIPWMAVIAYLLSDFRFFYL